ncbi:helix-turn-helix transcriptional regulator [Microbacterium album]|uniref:Helix-turn-helix transcriptional regulator n=1 Tax=Microbacterium album TaxID=2053191 RepID=A0A917ICN5_9MICO|nr:helix-turn-helix transcriptional regulator [Microbacterium album]
MARDAELAQLADALRVVTGGETRTVAVAGEAGIGKTRLLTEFVARHAGDARVLVGRCIDMGGAGQAYTSIAGALRALTGELGDDEVRRLAGDAGSALQRLPELAVGGATQSDASAGGLHEAIMLLLEAVSAERPVVLVIEDLHWVDPASLAVVRFLSRALTAARVLIIVTYRTEDIGRGHIARGFVTELIRDRRCVRVALERLDRHATRALMHELLSHAPDESAVDALLARSDGVPFYIEELVSLEACADEPGTLPDGLRELLLVRYERLSEEARRVVRRLAVGGVEVAHDLLAAVSEDGERSEFEDALREAMAGAVILATPTGYSFRHALVREAILDDVLPGERERLHGRYAVEYEARAEAGARVAAAIAHHWEGARDAARAFPAWVRAMREARATTGYASAAQHAERALSLWEVVPDPERAAGMGRLELMGRTATYLRNAGDVERSLGVLEAALRECAPGTFDHAMLLNNQARGLAIAARPGSIESYREALATLDALAARARAGSVDALAAQDAVAFESLRADVMVSLAGRLTLIGEDHEALELAREGAALAHRIGRARLESVGVNIGAICHAHLGRVDSAVDELERARHIAGSDGPALLRYWVNASDVAQHLGDYPRALAIAEEGLAAARTLGADRTSGIVLASNTVDPLLALGRWEEAESLLERYLPMALATTGRSYLVRDRAWLQLLRGDAPGAAETLASGRALFASTSAFELQSRVTVAHVTAEVSLALGDPARAWREAQLLLAQDPQPVHPGHVPPFAWTAARVISRAARESPESEVAAGRLRELIRDGGWPTLEAWAPLIEAELSPSVSTRRAALAVADDPRLPVQVRPDALLRLAETLLEDGERTEARACLDRAIAEARDRGTGGVLDQALTFGRSAGLRREAPSRRAADQLTDRERQVLGLVASGLSNRQIGERLFISGKTASVHVSAILRKLGATNRAEAAHLARDLPPH